jgi:hypothetical protein
VRRVQLDAVLRQLRLKSLPRAAELRIHGCFDDEGGVRQQAEAAEREAALIRQGRERGR